MKIALLGYGKMGKTIEALALEKGDEIILKIGSQNRGALTAVTLRQADVAIEFSEPDSAFDNIAFCLEQGIPVVSGTTAWLEHLPEAIEICEREKGAFMYASNFSIGVNVFFQLNRYLAEMMQPLQNYAVVLKEIHHTEKKDAPSGTAITLAKDIIDRFPTKKKWVSKETQHEGEVPILSERLPHVKGTHHVCYESAIDTIEIRHTAHSREGFASGALMAAHWLVGKQGFFKMEDMLRDMNIFVPPKP